ncbi:MAG: ATP-binding cassette domain-containing protein [Deltaproteobacteria bacterium]|nr:MAG: ATP-binding cassette domain-containing protein [Deltaproteobacteria bacterium]
MIRFENVTKFYGETPVLDDVTLNIERGNQVGLLGPGGAGKSLLVKIACGLVSPDLGTVTVNERDLGSLGPVELAEHRFQIGMLFQNYALFDYMTVGENIAFPLRQEGKLDELEIRNRVEDLLHKVDLPGIERNFPNELSGGMKKRVTFARAVVRNPDLLFYDDPTAGLDPVTSSKIFNLLEKVREDKNKTSIVITHDVLGVRDICDRFIVMDRGRILFRGDRQAIEDCDIKLVRQFWEGSSDG